VVELEMKQTQVPQIQQIQLETQPSSENEEHEEAPKEEDVDVENFQENVEMLQPTLRRSTWVNNPPKSFDDYVSYMDLISNDGEPSCY
jgi:SpoVK/Ycf46/Vps4 family AAA+-type ATPase